MKYKEREREKREPVRVPAENDHVARTIPQTTKKIINQSETGQTGFNEFNRFTSIMAIKSIHLEMAWIKKPSHHFEMERII